MLSLRNRVHAISPRPAAALLFFTATFTMPTVDRIEYLHVYRAHQEMHTFIDSICKIANLAYNELLLNMMNDHKIINTKIFPQFKIQAYNEKNFFGLLTTERSFLIVESVLSIQTKPKNNKW